MKFKTISTFALFHDGQIHVFNTGDSGELPDDVAAQYVAAGMAEPVKAKKGKAPASEITKDDDGGDADADAEDGDEGAAPIA